MLGKKVLEAINKQVNRELFSSYLYFSMSAWCQEKNLPGFANWMKIQAQEEMTHAMMMYQYIISQRGKAVMQAIEQPKIDWESPLKMFEHVLEHEKHVTSLINNIMSLAIKENDFATKSFYKWFIDEQVEEESNADQIINQIKMLGEDKVGLMMMDRELAARVFTPPSPASGAPAM